MHFSELNSYRQFYKYIIKYFRIRLIKINKLGSQISEYNSICYSNSMVGKYQMRVILLSFTIMFYQAIANTDLGVISELSLQDGNKWVGPILTSLMFLGSGLGSLYNKYLEKYSYRSCIFVGSFGYTIFIAMGIIFMKLGFSGFTITMIFIGAFIGGLIASVFYNSTYNYVNQLAHDDQQYIKYFGINIGIVQFCNLLGNLISALLIQQLGQIKYVTGLDIVIFLISCFFLCFKNPEKQHFQAINEELNEATIIQQIQDNNKLKNISPYRLFFIFGVTGIIVSFIYTQLSIIIYDTFSQDMDEISLNQLTFIIFIFEGVGEIFGGLYVVFYSFSKREPFSPFMVMIILFLLAMLIIYTGHVLKNYYIIGIGAVIAGITDCACMALALSIAGKWEKTGVTVYNMSQPLTICISCLLISFAGIQIAIAWIVFYLMAASVNLYWLDGKLKKIIQQ